MVNRVFNNLAVGAAAVSYSEPFDVGEQNTVCVQLVLVSGTLTSVQLWLSDDLENWVADPTTIVIPTAPSHSITAVYKVASRYGRLRVDGATAICMSAYVNTVKI